MVKEPTEEQSKILQQKGNIVITAKPGSGKTYTIVEKIARVIPDLPEYKGVIAISFTNKASDELKRRCKQRCADTKQSFFGTIDKFYISQIIIPFSSHVTGNITEYEIVDNIDESSKYALLLEEPFSSKKESILVEGLQEGKIFLKYTGETALYILENVPGAMQYIKARYSHIIIDEYQDCGEIQDKVFIKLVESGLTGIAVGDINQAIYGFTKRFPKYLIPNEFGDESSVQQDLNLHYVGLTRAKDACYIMNGTARFRSKKNDYIFAEPSLFLSKPGLAERRKDVRWEM